MIITLWILGISLAAIAYLSAGYLLADLSIRTQGDGDVESLAGLLMFPLHHYWGELKRHGAAKLDRKHSSEYPGTALGWYIFMMMVGWPVKVTINSVLLLFLAAPLIIKRQRSRPAKPKGTKPAPAKTAAETYSELVRQLDQTPAGQEPLLEAQRLMELRTHVEKRLKTLPAALEEQIEEANRQLAQVRDLAQPVVLDTDERLYRMLANEYGDHETADGPEREKQSEK